MMYSAYKLNKQGESIQPSHIPFPIWNLLSMSSSNLLPDLHIGFSRSTSGGLVFPSQNLPQFIVVHTVKGFGIVNKAEIDVSLELSCFFDDPVDAGNFISGSCSFPEFNLNIWNFSVHILLKPGLENFEHYLTSL